MVISSLLVTSILGMRCIQVMLEILSPLDPMHSDDGALRGEGGYVEKGKQCLVSIVHNLEC